MSKKEMSAMSQMHPTCTNKIIQVFSGEFRVTAAFP
jgi:hypothetical protein